MVVVDGMGIEEFAGVVGLIAGLLQPDRKVVVIESLAHELRVASCQLISLYSHGSLSGRSP